MPRNLQKDEIVKKIELNKRNSQSYLMEFLNKPIDPLHLQVINLLCKDKQKLLPLASEEGNADLVKLLLENGANVHTKDDFPLRWASKNGHLEVVKLLLSAGANVHALDGDPLCSASIKGHVEVAKLLLQAGANIHANNDSSLRWASENGHLDVVKLLLLYYPSETVIKQKFPEHLDTYLKLHRGLRKFQTMYLDRLWEPDGVICQRNYKRMVTEFPQEN